ncbi:MAG: nucleoside-diphosphate kinase [Euryarchaeota archaeon RBG_16_62_10]|nr:MAG: nucleoside-diphosphate kinase [Euryarchaeota archaeon RBG_16_62_10]
MERTFVMVKPDGVQRGLVGNIVQRFEERGYKVCAMKMLRIQHELAERHYEEHKSKEFFEPLLSYITSGPVVCMVLEGENAVATVRAMMGKTNPQDAAPGTIRADFAQVTGRNIVHGSDSSESAKREIKLFFNDYELQKYEKADEPWVFEK